MKKAIELLEEAISWIEKCERTWQINLVKWRIRNEAQPRIEQALSLLRQEPEPSEFTKHLRICAKETREYDINFILKSNALELENAATFIDTLTAEKEELTNNKVELELKVLDIVSQLIKAKAKLKGAEEKNRWIPVSEKPKKKGFITAIDMESFAITSFFFNGTEKVWSALVLKNYTHWKPIILPEQALGKEEATDGIASNK